MHCSRTGIALTVIVLLVTFAAVQAHAEYYKILIPSPSPSIIQTMGELGFPLDDSRMIKGEGLEIILDDREVALLESNFIQYRVLQEDLEKYYEEICLENLQNIPPATDEDPVHMKYGSMGGFYNFQEIVADLDSMHLLYPDICAEKVVIGSGWDENPLYMVKISDNVNVNEDEPEGIFDALHHAREPGGYTSALYAMWYLLENYGIDPEVTYLVDNRELYFVPVVNPDGLLYNQQTNPNGGGMWRKNRRDNGGGVYGVDLNRNYPYQWGYDNSGSSPYPSSSTYRGPSAGSEPETQAMMNFINNHNFATGMTVHTYGEDYLSAYGYDDVPPEHYDVHMDYMSYAAQENGYTYGYCYQIMYASNGRTQDWQLHEKDIINIEPEIGDDGFWPSINLIFPQARENLNCYLNQFWCAGGQVIFSSIAVADGFLTPGETEELIVEVFNRGWGTSEAVSFELTTSDPYFTLSTATSSTGPLLRRTTADNAADPFIADVDPSCPIGHEALFTLTIDQGGYLRTEEISLVVGTPTVFFADDAESGTGNWTIGNYWGTDSDNPHGGVYSFSDSPGREYYNNTTAIITVAQPVNLSSATSVWLDFWARWAIESNWDFCQLEVSTNGFDWTAVPGLYTVAGSGIGVQPSGQPGWEGTQASWVHESVDLNAYAGESFFKFRFKLRSDGGVTEDGFFFDDLQLLGFTETLPPGDVSVNLTYQSGSPVPASGGNLYFDVYVENYGTVPVDFDAWLDISYEGGSPTTVVQRSFTDYQPGWTINRPNMYFPVPSSYAPGNYTMTGKVGQYPVNAWDESGFPWSKAGVADGSAFIPTVPDGVPDPFDRIDTGSSGLPGDFALTGAYPNPFNPVTTVTYALPEAGYVNLTLYDVFGRRVQVLTDGFRDAGIHTVTFDASDLASGLYLLKMQTDAFSAVEKLVLMQ
jgi:murein tripeptide amidase MpaA